LYEKILEWRSSRSGLGKVPKSRHAPKLDELMLECKRMRLLRSSDPEEVEEGRNMVTPASLFEALASEGDLASDEDVHALGLGDISPREAGLRADREIAVGDPANIEEIHNPLPGGMGADTDMNAGSPNIPEARQAVDADETSDESGEGLGAFEKMVMRTNVRSGSSPAHIWLPLTFPPVPKKV
jgi:DNA-directed RNA polymerase